VDGSSFTPDNTSDNQKSTELNNVPTPQAAESGAANNETIVTATQLRYRTPGDALVVPGVNGVSTNPQAQIGVGMLFPAANQPVVYALDANSNLDINYNDPIIINTSPILLQSHTHTNFTNGVLTLSTYRLMSAGSAVIRVFDNAVPFASTAVSTSVTNQALEENLDR
jgi:hypothetical protein